MAAETDRAQPSILAWIGLAAVYWGLTVEADVLRGTHAIVSTGTIVVTRPSILTRELCLTRNEVYIIYQ